MGAKYVLMVVSPLWRGLAIQGFTQDPGSSSGIVESIVLIKLLLFVVFAVMWEDWA